MSSDKTSESTVPKSTKDLDDLLDSALEDFDKPAVAAAAETKASDSAASEKDVLAGAKPEQDEQWNEEFLSQAKYFEEQMAALFGGGAAGAGAGGLDAAVAAANSEQFNVGFEKLAEAAQRACAGDVGAVDATYVDHITQALKGLKDGSESITAANPLDNMGDMLAGLNLSDLGNSDDSNPFMPFVQGMMHSLLSAEVLLPSLRELLEKYPVWMAENDATLAAEDRERYNKQQDLFKVICADLEQERADDSADVKSERFKRVLAHMQKLHEYGQPPTELVGGDEAMAGMPGLGGMPGMPGGPGAAAMGDPSQCSIM